MPADTTTTSLGLLLQGTGNNDNTWGQLLDEQVIQYIEDALVGRTAVSTTGGATTLTQAQCRPRYIDITGVLSSDAVITVPNTKNSWIITNSTTGGFWVTVKTAGGTATTIPQNTSKEVYCDGAAAVLRVDRNLVGEYFFHGGTSAPAGGIECDGGTASRTGAIDLFTKIGTTHGVGDGVSTFTLPDAKTAGRFLRSRTASVTAGTLQTNQNLAHTHANTFAVASDGAHTHSGTTAAETQEHTHGVSGATGTDSVGHTHSGTTSTQSADHTHSGTTGNDSPDHTHAGGDLFDAEAHTAFNVAGGATSLVTVVNQTGAGNTGGVNNNHQHAFTSGGVSANHTHTVTTGAESVDHTHSFSVTSAGRSAAHDHTFTTSSNGAHVHSLSGSITSDGGTEARPNNISGILCIRF